MLPRRSSSVRSSAMDNAVIHGEWIGKDVLVKDASNPSLLGVEGVVVDETKHLLVVRTSKGDKRIPKRLSVFRIKWDHDVVEVKGDDILASPEERIKKRHKKP